MNQKCKEVSMDPSINYNCLTKDSNKMYIGEIVKVLSKN